MLTDEDPKLGFKLAPDLKWDGKDPKMLYLTAVALDGSVRCLRDLRGEHLPLLRNIQVRVSSFHFLTPPKRASLTQAMSREAILAKYGVRGEQVRMFMHYHPSYFHLHVHMVRLGADYPGMQVPIGFLPSLMTVNDIASQRKGRRVN